MFRHNWEPAEGTVIDTLRKGHHTSDQSANIRFLVEVRVSGRDPFRVELGMPGLFGDFVPPNTGQIVKLQVEPHGEKTRFDTSDPALSAKAIRKAAAARFASNVAAPAGPPVPPSPPPRSAAPVTKLLTAAQVLATGLPVRVVLAQADPMGRTNAAGVDIYALVLSICRDGQPPTPITVGNPVPDDRLALLYPGSELPAKMLADNAQAIVIDWDATRTAQPRVN